MKKILLLIFLCAVNVNAADTVQDAIKAKTEAKKAQDAQKKAIEDDQLLDIKPNKYGQGVNSDQYGRPTKYEVIGDPAADTSLLKVKQDAYGSGVSQDQYGRAVKNTAE